ncbi:MAG: hypothetical protein H0T89_02350 [Deltaproteobacteria bacterium]|nr:hypothetical protein [Deltaproteobacteria bacterium]
MLNRWLVLTLVATGCGCPPGAHDCVDEDSSPPVYHGEAFHLRAVGPAGDHFVALVGHTYYDEDPLRFQTDLVELDRSGALLSTTELSEPLVVNAHAVAGDGLGSTVVVGEHVGWFANGASIAELALDGDAAVTFAGGSYWLAIASKPRQVLRYDTSGNQLEMIVVPDEQPEPGVASAPSLAIDALEDGIRLAGR